jgi:aminoglycoside N3'-acetyltransferase
LKGDAARIVMRLGADTNLETLLHKLESAYGIYEYLSERQFMTVDVDSIVWDEGVIDITSPTDS